MVPARKREQRPVVLIVEDEPLVRDIAVDEFEDAGYDVIVAADAQAALDVLESGEPLDLLFTDIRIPGSVDGWGVASTARQLRPALPVIYATGFSQEELRMVQGARFFRKPYKVAAIIDVASELIAAA